MVVRRHRPDELNSVGVSTAARVLGVSRETIYNWADNGTIRLHPMTDKHGRTGKPVLRVMRSDLEGLMRRKGKK
jgi:excisionase family DNA binding protein